MVAEESKPIQAREKQEAYHPAEQTWSGLTFTPAVDVFETEKNITILADLPGVKAEDLSIDLKDNILTLSGGVQDTESENEVNVIREYETGRYFRQFSLSEVIDQSKIDAKLTDGVLKLVLPKVEAATPRKITVKAD